jgi:hypothetical protein
VTITPEAASPQAFVRTLSTAATVLDLTDLVAGGDGTTGRRGRAIDTRTGAVGVLPPVGTYAVAAAANPTCQTVPGVPVVDGVFVPSGRAKVDSAGHTFDFPANDGRTFNHLWAGGTIPAPDGLEPPATRLGGVDYAEAGRGLLFMHSNKGLTVDLTAVRRLHPGRQLTRFRCAVGNTRPAGRAFRADAFVLVDGKPRFERRGFADRDHPTAVDVPLGAGDRFLTLAVTDGGDGIGQDWVIWADPSLDLAGR